MISRAELISQLRERGIRLTAQRLAVAEAMLNSKDHPTAQQIHDAVRERVPYVTRSTVYNTLSMLVQWGLVHALPFAGGIRYENNLAFHVNVVCTRCGTIFDAPDTEALISRLKAEVAVHSGFQISSQRLDFYGLCGSCSS